MEPHARSPRRQRGFVADRVVAKILRKLAFLSLLVAATLALGVLGYVAIEGWSPFDALYMTVITTSMVGDSQIHPLSAAGKTFTMLLIVVGASVVVYGISAITAFVVEGDLTNAWKRSKMRTRIEGLRGHYLVCGDSGASRYCVEELHRTGRDFVVLERDAAKTADLAARDIPCLDGDPAADAALRSAGIERAAGLIAALGSDADNLFLVFTARGLNPALRIISVALAPGSAEKLRKAGADGVVMPDAIGGLRLASELIRPDVVSFLDAMLRDRDASIRVEEVRVREGYAAVGRTLAETGVTALAGASLVALARPAQPYLFNPPPATRLAAGDKLIVLGESRVVSELERRFAAGG